MFHFLCHRNTFLSTFDQHYHATCLALPINTFDPEKINEFIYQMLCCKMDGIRYCSDVWCSVFSQSVSIRICLNLSFLLRNGNTAITTNNIPANLRALLRMLYLNFVLYNVRTVLVIQLLLATWGPAITLVFCTFRLRRKKIRDRKRQRERETESMNYMERQTLGIMIHNPKCIGTLNDYRTSKQQDSNVI